MRPPDVKRHCAQDLGCHHRLALFGLELAHETKRFFAARPAPPNVKRHCAQDLGCFPTQQTLEVFGLDLAHW